MMAGLAGKKTFEAVLKAKPCMKIQTAHVSNQSRTETIRNFMRSHKLAVTVAATAVGVAAALTSSVAASGLELHPPHYAWSHNGIFQSYDHQSIRRGYQVYKQVCAACHSLKYIHYRDLIGVCMTEDEAKADAAEAMIEDGPDSEGKMFMRPGKLFDKIPSPYPNRKAAEAANSGAYPPDLSYLVAAREGNEDYVFSILTGYCDAPKNMEPNGELHYNPYFAGSWIAMAKAIYNDIIQYEDGTPATQSQLAKDVTTFLKWTSEPEHDRRKRIFLTLLPLMAIAGLTAIYIKRNRQVIHRSRIIKRIK